MPSFFGAATCDGIWVGKDSSTPNIHGIRLDLIEAAKECELTNFRWPGGCCAEKYHWLDGVGPTRMPRMHFARDKNKGIWVMSFGTDAFLELCELCNLYESLFDVDGEHFVKTPTFRVMKLFKEHLEQDLLEGAFTAGDGIDALASINADGNRVTLTAANRNLYDSATLTLCPELREMNIVMSDIVNTKNVRAYNSPDHPEEITQIPFQAISPEITLPPHSVIRVVFTK